MHFYNTYRPYFSHLLKLSYPIIIGQLGVVLMGVADVIMIGKLTPVNLAAASLANAVYFFIAILGIGTLTAISPLVAKAKAEGHNNDCAMLFRQGFYASLILSAAVVLILAVGTFFLPLLKQDKEVTFLTIDYLHILNAGTLPMFIFLALKQFSDGLSLTKPSAVITIIALLINIALNYMLIYGKLGFKPMGLFGAGIATTVSRLFMALTMFAYISKSPIYHLYIKIKDRSVHPQFLKQIFKVGLPSGFQYFFEVGAFAGAAVIIGWIGKNEQAAHQVAINVASTTYMIALGISAAGSIAVGDAYGRKNKTDMARSGKAALILGTCFMGTTAVLLALFNNEIALAYVSDTIVAEMAAGLMFIAALFQLSDGLQCVGLGILRGIQDTKIPTVITIFAYWVVGLPLGYLMAFKYQFSLYGIWYALLLGLSISAALLTYRFFNLSKRINVFNNITHEQKA